MSEEEVLTDEESEALLEESEPLEAAGDGVSNPGDDFWEQVAPDRIPELDAINEEMAEMLTRIWAGMFRRQIVVSAAPVRQMTGRVLAKRIKFEATVSSFEIQGRDEQCLLIVQPDTVSAMVEICFGGTGAGARSEHLAGLTEMEGRMFARFCEALREGLTEIWRKRANVGLLDSAEPFSVSEHALCNSGGPVVTSGLLFDVAQSEHSIDLVWPATLIDVLRERKPRSLPAAQQRPEFDWGTRIREEVRGASIEVRAVIGGIPLRLHEISSAQTGDIIMTESLNRVCLLAGDQPVFEGTLGSHNGLNAVKITQPFAQGRSGDA